MMLNLLLAAVLLQDPSVDDLVRSLSSDDIAVREKATRELQALGLDKLPQMEKHLRDPNAEVAMRVRQSMGRILASTLGTRKVRFELRPAAPDATTDDWIATGADIKKPPKGYEARRFHPGSSAPSDKPWILLGEAIATERDIEQAHPEPPTLDSSSWSVRFKLGKEGAKRFDALAAELYERSPRGKAAILLDDRVLVVPQINAKEFRGVGMIYGTFSEGESRKIAGALKGEWLESFMRFEAEENSSTGSEKTADFLRGLKGFEKTTVKPDGAALEVNGLLDLKEVDLVNLWQSLRERGYRLAPKK